MLLSSEIRLGIVVSETTNMMSSYALGINPIADYLVESCGCLESNIQVKFVPSDFDIPLGVLFFAEYTDVDGVIVIGGVYDVIAKSLLDLQIQWNMPIEYSSDSLKVGSNVIRMVQIQSQMAAEVPEEQRIPVANRRDNVN